MAPRTVLTPEEIDLLEPTFIGPTWKKDAFGCWVLPHKTLLAAVRGAAAHRDTEVQALEITAQERLGQDDDLRSTVEDRLPNEFLGAGQRGLRVEQRGGRLDNGSGQGTAVAREPQQRKGARSSHETRSKTVGVLGR